MGTAINELSISETSELNINLLQPLMLRKLPPELRIKIYSLVFNKSTVELRISGYDHNKSSSPDTHRHERDVKAALLCRRSTRHWKFLLTCRSIYQDALPTYWSESLIICKSVHSKARHCYLNDVADAIPPIILQNVKHLRNVLLPRIDSTHVCPANPLPCRRPLGAEAVISRFPMLQTCEFHIARGDKRGKIDIREMFVTEWSHKGESKGMFKTRSKDVRNPQAWLLEAYGVSKEQQQKVHFLTKYKAENIIFTDRLHSKALIYLDYSQQTFAVTRFYPIYNHDDEKGFQMAMQVPIEIPNIKSEEDEETITDTDKLIM